MCTKKCQWDWPDRQRNFRFRPGSEHGSLSEKLSQPMKFHDLSLSTCSSSSCGSAVAAASERDKRRLVDCGSTLPAKNGRSDIWKCKSMIITVENLSESRLPCPIRTEAHAVKCAAQFRLVFWMALQVTQLMHAMSELTFITVFAFASFLEWTTKFRLVAKKTKMRKS
jgi:hypothetical protein